MLKQRITFLLTKEQLSTHKSIKVKDNFIISFLKRTKQTNLPTPSSSSTACLFVQRGQLGFLINVRNLPLTFGTLGCALVFKLSKYCNHKTNNDCSASQTQVHIWFQEMQKLLPVASSSSPTLPVETKPKQRPIVTIPFTKKELVFQRLINTNACFS